MTEYGQTKAKEAFIHTLVHSYREFTHQRFISNIELGKRIGFEVFPHNSSNSFNYLLRLESHKHMLIDPLESGLAAVMIGPDNNAGVAVLDMIHKAIIPRLNQITYEDWLHYASVDHRLDYPNSLLRLLIPNQFVNQTIREVIGLAIEQYKPIGNPNVATLYLVGAPFLESEDFAYIDKVAWSRHSGNFYNQLGMNDRLYYAPGHPIYDPIAILNHNEIIT